MRIGIDARFAVRSRRGIGNYTLGLINHLAELDHQNEYLLYVDSDDQERVLPTQENFRARKIGPANYAVWEQLLLPARAKEDRVDVLHCTGNTAPILLDRRIRLVVTIHDMMYLKTGSLLPRSACRHQRLGRVYRSVIVPRAARHAARVVTVSHFSKEEILTHLPFLRDEDVVVVYEAGNDTYHPLDRDDAVQQVRCRYGISGNYILSLGGIDPRKNTRLLVQSFLELKHQGTISERLLVVGVPKCAQTMFFDHADSSTCRGETLFLDFVSEEDLLLLYNGATVFVYPSLFEGFGLPPLEAMACGTPVISSNTTSIPEIAGDGALLIDPTDGNCLKRVLADLLHDRCLCEQLTRRGFDRVRQFSWQKTAAETLAVYESLLQERL